MSRRSKGSSISTTGGDFTKRPLSVLTNWARVHSLTKEAIVEQVVSLVKDTDTTTMVLRALQEIRTEENTKNRRAMMPGPPQQQLKQSNDVLELESLHKKHIEELLRLQRQREEEQMVKMYQELEKQREKLLQLESHVNTTVKSERIREPFGVWQPQTNSQIQNQPTEAATNSLQHSHAEPMSNFHYGDWKATAWDKPNPSVNPWVAQVDDLSPKNQPELIKETKPIEPELKSDLIEPIPKLPDFQEILKRVEQYQKPKLDSLKKAMVDKQEEEEKKRTSEKFNEKLDKQKLRSMLEKNLKIVEEREKLKEDEKLLRNFVDNELKKTREEKLEQIAKHEVYLSNRASLAAKAEMLAEVEPFRMPSTKTIVSAITCKDGASSVKLA